jgi:hypothetical protein
MKEDLIQPVFYHLQRDWFLLISNKIKQNDVLRETIKSFYFTSGIEIFGRDFIFVTVVILIRGITN